jgi:hypothetical protein
MPTLDLTLTDYIDPTRWVWRLSDGQGRYLADHEVRLDPTSREYAGFLDLAEYLEYYKPIKPPEQALADLGAWIGEQVFRGVREALWQHRARPAVAVRVALPPAAGDLLLRPLELARFADGTGFLQAGVRFVYQVGDESIPARGEARDSLRLLAAFSLPARASPLNLRRERFGLERLVRDLAETQGLALELQVLQYGATRETLQAALEKDPGWDVIHLSGHGTQGELLLEDAAGGWDMISAEELAELLQVARGRLQLLILDTCYSAAGGQAAARAELGLEPEPAARRDGGEDKVGDGAAPTHLPSLARMLSARLDCAALAMRYPVGDAFAIDLMLSLYEKLLDRGQPLPGALHLALDEALAGDVPRPPLSVTTPILVGSRAAELRLSPPRRPVGIFQLPQVGLDIHFPGQPPRLVGRLQPMLRASQALAPRSDKRGVLFYGMPGAGKTSCALELAYRHAEDRFRGYIWYKAPEAGSETPSALFNLMQDIQTQLNAPDLGLTTALDDPQQFRQYILPRLRALLQQHSLLLVLDNLESLLLSSNHWRDPLWGDTVAALLGHDGLSRTVLTSRRCPAGLAGHPRLQAEAIHALSLAESVLLARELPHLRRLFRDEEGLALLRETLRVVQGHPQLLELADSLASDRAALAARTAAAAAGLAAGEDRLDAFFARDGPGAGETALDEARFARELRGWTEQLVRRLSPTAQLLLAFLSRLEPEDRQKSFVDANWESFLERLGEKHPAAVVARAEPEAGLPAALAALDAAGLVGTEQAAFSPAQLRELQGVLAGLLTQGDGGSFDPANLPQMLAGLATGATTYHLHPGVAEAVRAAAEARVLETTDLQLGNFWGGAVWQGLQHEVEGGGGMVVEGARRATPYLLRSGHWGEAAALLERMLQRDSSPSSLAFALPLLRRLAETAAGDLETRGILAWALQQDGRVAEAEGMLRDLVARAANEADYRLASNVTGKLIDLLMSSGRLPEALAAAEEKAGYTRQAGLGPWTHLADEGRRLQVLNALGRYDEVLEAVERLRPQMEALPLEGELEENAVPWNVREELLNAGNAAAVYTKRWEAALALNAEIMASKRARGADALAQARARFNDYSPLLGMKRYAEARELLQGCRAVYEAERDVTYLGGVYSALADLESRIGGQAEAAGFEKAALGYRYRANKPEGCAISHNNLADYLEREGAAPAAAMAHRLAAALIFLQIQSGRLPNTVQNLASSDLPTTPPPFDTVVDRVESVAGVRFRALFEGLPRTAPDGDAALAALWQLLSELAGPDTGQALKQFEPVLKAVVEAVHDESLRAVVAAGLSKLEEKGWMLTEPVRRIWAGERDAAALTGGLDARDGALVRRILELLET